MKKATANFQNDCFKTFESSVDATSDASSEKVV